MNKNRSSTALLLLASIGVLTFIYASFTLIFQDKVFKALYPKPFSLASEIEGLPKVDLMINTKNGDTKGVMNVDSSETPLLIAWKTSGNPLSCTGRVWGSSGVDSGFEGPKDVAGGTYKTAELKRNGAYVYSIDCQNDKGDAPGDSVTVNVGAKFLNFAPFITSLDVSLDEEKLDTDSPIVIPSNKKVRLIWESTNTSTPFSVCSATGSWPTNYQNIRNSKIEEELLFASQKMYQFRVFCTNESGSSSKVVQFITK